MSCNSWSEFLVYISPPLAALLSATALWVGSQARSTFGVERPTSQDTLRPSREPSTWPEPSGWETAAPDLRRSSGMTPDPGGTSTSPGDEWAVPEQRVGE